SHTTRLTFPKPTSHQPAEGWAFDAFPTENVQLLQLFVSQGEHLKRIGLLAAADATTSKPLNAAIIGPISTFRTPHSAFHTPPLLASTQLPLISGVAPQYLVWEFNEPMKVDKDKLYGLLLWRESGTGRYLLNLHETSTDPTSAQTQLLVLQNNSAPTKSESQATALGGLVLKSFFDWVDSPIQSAVQEPYIGGQYKQQ
ncbi:hypothetical protein DRH29_03680, partial [candidate division Kazan bacterium]